MGFGVPEDMSAPTSAMTSADRALILVPGLVPAEWTSTAPAAWCSMRAAAIWDLPPFLAHTNRTEGVVLVIGAPGSGRAGGAGSG
jgi:hypothetical protein